MRGCGLFAAAASKVTISDSVRGKGVNVGRKYHVILHCYFCITTYHPATQRVPGPHLPPCARWGYTAQYRASQVKDIVQVAK